MIDCDYTLKERSLQGVIQRIATTRMWLRWATVDAVEASGGVRPTLRPTDATSQTLKTT